MTLATFIHGSAHDLHAIPDASVQMIATSPPYLGLRAYQGDQAIEWPSVTYRLNEWVEPTTIEAMTCGLGMEPSPVAYIGHLILCLREWRRVLRDDGTIWVNLGDSYAGSNALTTNEKALAGKQGTNRGTIGTLPRRVENNGVKPKDLLGIPWLFAIAARADGWFLRSDIIWAKPNPMPESVTDRPTKSHEYIFLLAKSQRYFWDQEAVSVESQTAGKIGGFTPNAAIGAGVRPTGNMIPERGKAYIRLPTRNIRSVWFVATQPTPFAHFATWPPKLVETMVKAGTSEHGACPTCGKAWERVVERTAEGYNEKEGVAQRLRNAGASNGGTERVTLGVTHKVHKSTQGWRPACTCREYRLRPDLSEQEREYVMRRLGVPEPVV